MPPLDIRTLSLVLTMVAILMVVTGLVLWRASRTEAATRYWLLGNLGFALGFLFIGLRGQVPTLISVPVANACLVAGQGLFLIGTETFLRLRPSWRLWGAAVGAQFFAFLFFTYVQPDVGIRILIVSGLMALFAFVTAGRLWRAPAAERDNATRLVAFICALYGGYLLLRIGLTVVDGPIADFMTANTVQAIAFINVIVMLVVINLGFASMLNGRLVREREARAVELERAHEQAHAGSRAKSRFLAGMSHELRTPLNAVLGFAQLMEINPKEPLAAAQRSAVGNILSAGQHLLRLISDVLDMAKVEAGRLEVFVSNVPAAAGVSEAVDMIRGEADKRAIAIDVVDDGWLMVRADQARLRQCLINVLSNAVKYNHEGGRVVVSWARATGGMVRFTITDTGPGIDPSRASELFQPFSRLGADDKAIEGTGVGLALTRQLIELMGGRVGCDIAVGQGSTFWLEVPEAAPTTPSATPPSGGIAAIVPPARAA
jgi:signal transduction histidine kinase